MKITKTSLLLAGTMILMGTVDASKPPVTPPAAKAAVTTPAAKAAAPAQSSGWLSGFKWPWSK